MSENETKKMSNVARTFANELVTSLKLDAPIDLVDVCRHLGLEIRYCDASGFDGALVCSKENRVGTVLIKKSIRELGRMKFTIAHEIAHYVLPHHGASGSVCGPRDVENWDRTLPEEEQEANAFAGELLIPQSLVEAALLREKPNFDAIRSLSAKFETSLTAAAYRAMQLTPFRAAIVWSTNDIVRWFKASEEFEAFVSVRESVSEGTYAHDCFKGISVPDDFRSVKSASWLAASSAGNPEYILEHSIWLPFYNSVLTLLYVEDVGHSLQDDDRGSLEEMNPEDFTVKRKRWPR
jgi:Zn-dependent peptidase ImmA (M78 family)